MQHLEFTPFAQARVCCGRKTCARQEGSTSLNTPDSQLPTAEQLAAARSTRWHQQGEALLTFENLRSWINACGLVLFAPRPQQLPAPAPSMVEGVLGAPNASPTPEETEEARSLLERLVAEGVAVPLNLFGTMVDTPDFVVSTAAFPYIFTLRGDKLWKKPPATSGATKVSPLALAAYNLLAEHITLTSYDLTTHLGKEVTESAVLRALNELWSQLRVLPIPQPNGAPAQWELTTTRFTKHLKAGANAGLPSALSSLISLYLNTVVLATEEEIELFLSPLSARSRTRDVVHALLAARQLESVVIEGKTLLHIAGEAPAFLSAEPVVDDAETIEVLPVIGDGEEEISGEGTRIKKFVPKPRKVGTGFVGRPKPAFGARPAASNERERRPFERKPKPDFTKPWDEEKKARRAPRDAAEGGERKPYTPKPRFDDRGGDRPAFSRKPFGDRTGGGREDRPSFNRKPFGDRPRFDRNDRGESRPPRSGFAAKGRDLGDSRPPRREFSPRPDGESRPPRREFGAGNRAGSDSRPPRRDFKPRSGGDDRPQRRSFTPRSEEGSFPKRKPFVPREGASRFGNKPFAPREGGSSRFGNKPFTPREGGAPRFGNKSSASEGRGFSSRGRSDGPPFRKFDAPRGDRPARAEGSSFKPKSGFGAKKPFAKAGGGKPWAGKPAGARPSGGRPANFASKPFAKRAAPRKPRREDGESEA